MLRDPTDRNAQLTPFFTKFRSSEAARAISGKQATNFRSWACLSCSATEASNANEARRTNSCCLGAHRLILLNACGVRSNSAKHVVSQIPSYRSPGTIDPSALASPWPHRPRTPPASALHTSRSATARSQGRGLCRAALPSIEACRLKCRTPASTRGRSAPCPRGSCGCQGVPVLREWRELWKRLRPATSSES